VLSSTVPGHRPNITKYSLRDSVSFGKLQSVLAMLRDQANVVSGPAPLGPLGTGGSPPSVHSS
jgi:hypothetical protein